MAQPIRAAFFDIDGTLLTFGDRQMPDSTTRALRKMHDAGILLFISSGRPPFQLKRLPPIQAIPFDGFILTNGQFCADREMNPFFVRALPGESMPVLLGWLEQHPDVLCTFAEESYSYNNRPTSQAMTRRCLDCGVLPPNQPVEDPARALTHTTYQLNLYMPPEMDQAFRQAVPGCRAVRWNDAFADIIPAEGGKAAGLARMMDRFGLTASQCIAFGDGGNDVEMLQAAGIGVAMGNAAPDVQAAADYVTEPVDRDGIWNAAIHFGLIQE